VKGAIFGAVGVCGVGAVVVGGGGGPDDFIAVVSKPPSAVYAAFAQLANAGNETVSIPKEAGGYGTFTRRFVKVQNEQVKVEFLIDGQPLVTAEVQMAPEGTGTRLAAELDFDDDLLRRIVKETGAEMPVPPIAFQDFLVDQAFAQIMRESVERIEAGKPLLSLDDTHARWGSSGSSRGGTFSEVSSHSRWQQHQAVQPQLSTRPALDPSAAAQDVSR
jgi:hypothetical protein